MPPRLAVEGLSKRYGSTTALDRLDLQVGAGEVCAIAGPNGCGKTTFLELVEGLRQPDEGTITLDGEPFDWRRPRDGRVGAQLQEESLPARITVREALRFYAIAGGVEFPADLVDLLDLAPLLEQRFISLSGGQKRRTILALAALGIPGLVLLDEPTSGLDPLGVEKVDRLVARLVDRGVAVVLATHDLDQVARVADQALFLNHGTVSARGTVAELLDAVGATTVLELANGRLAADEVQELGITRVLRLGSTVLHFGDDDLPGRLRDWSGYDAALSAAGGEVRVRRVTLLDSYLRALPAEDLRGHRDAVAAWGGRS